MQPRSPGWRPAAPDVEGLQLQGGASESVQLSWLPFCCSGCCCCCCCLAVAARAREVRVKSVAAPQRCLPSAAQGCGSPRQATPAGSKSRMSAFSRCRRTPRCRSVLRSHRKQYKAAASAHHAAHAASPVMHCAILAQGCMVTALRRRVRRSMRTCRLCGGSPGSPAAAGLLPHRPPPAGTPESPCRRQTPHRLCPCWPALPQELFSCLQLSWQQ
jgi:hypothetical protein